MVTTIPENEWRAMRPKWPYTETHGVIVPNEFLAQSCLEYYEVESCSLLRLLRNWNPDREFDPLMFWRYRKADGQIWRSLVDHMRFRKDGLRPADLLIAAAYFGTPAELPAIFFDRVEAAPST